MINTIPLEDFPPMQTNERTKKQSNSRYENFLKIRSKMNVADRNQTEEKRNVGECVMSEGEYSLRFQKTEKPSTATILEIRDFVSISEIAHSNALIPINAVTGSAIEVNDQIVARLALDVIPDHPRANQWYFCGLPTSNGLLVGPKRAEAQLFDSENT